MIMSLPLTPLELAENAANGIEMMMIRENEGLIPMRLEVIYKLLQDGMKYCEFIKETNPKAIEIISQLQKAIDNKLAWQDKDRLLSIQEFFDNAAKALRTEYHLGRRARILAQRNIQTNTR